jgi:hypothetical protein
MPRARTPLAKAKATGQTLNHATRYKSRKEPVVKDPPRQTTEMDEEAESA